MNVYLVTIKIGSNYDERYVSATTAEQAIEIVRNDLTPAARRWANVFVG